MGLVNGCFVANILNTRYLLIRTITITDDIDDNNKCIDNNNKCIEYDII